MERHSFQVFISKFLPFHLEDIHSTKFPQVVLGVLKAPFKDMMCHRWQLYWHSKKRWSCVSKWVLQRRQVVPCGTLCSRSWVPSFLLTASHNMNDAFGRLPEYQTMCFHGTWGMLSLIWSHAECVRIVFFKNYKKIYVERIRDWKCYEYEGIVATNPTRPISSSLEVRRESYDTLKIRDVKGIKRIDFSDAKMSCATVYMANVRQTHE